MIGSMKPGEAMCGESGWTDNHASVVVSRDPRDGMLDVFAEVRAGASAGAGQGTQPHVAQ